MRSAHKSGCTEPYVEGQLRLPRIDMAAELSNNHNQSGTVLSKHNGVYQEWPIVPSDNARMASVLNLVWYRKIDLMAVPDFSPETITLLAFRACLICNNPRCATVTVGPSDAKDNLAIKLGEAAHICAKRPNQARYEATMSDDQRAAPENGIWLCASCHTMVDKNLGHDFPKEVLLDWKRKHEEVIRSLLYTHRSPWPLIRKFTEEGQIAQEVVDALENHGALFVDRNLENPPHVLLSIDRLRSELLDLARGIRYDSQLKDLVKDLAKECREFMNFSSPRGKYDWHELETMRSRLGVLILRLKEDYGCNIRGSLNHILPR